MVPPANGSFVLSLAVMFDKPVPSPEKAAAVTVPVVLISVVPPIVPEVTALPETLPAVVIVAKLESGREPVTLVVKSMPESLTSSEEFTFRTIVRLSTSAAAPASPVSPLVP
jgi:hypothetical protein